MEINQDLMQLSSDLTKILTTGNTVQFISDKINLAKGKKDNIEIINNLEEIINQLISEKNQLIAIAQAFDERIVAQKMSDNELEYVTNAVIPLIKKLMEEHEDKDLEKEMQQLEIIETLLSKQTLNVLQILGFNFKKAIGEPLTDLVQALILSQKPTTPELNYKFQIANDQKELEILKIMQDEESYKRFLELQKGS